MLAIKKGAASLFLPIIEPASTKAPDKYTVTLTASRRHEPSAREGLTRTIVYWEAGQHAPLGISRGWCSGKSKPSSSCRRAVSKHGRAK
jgi:hypothetical protein